MKPEWRVYLVQCRDGSLYCGISTNVPRRVKQHNTSRKGAKYTRGRRPVTLVAVSRPQLSHGEALQLECKVKAMAASHKLKFLQEDLEHYHACLDGWVDGLSFEEEA